MQALVKKTFGNHLFLTNVGISFGLSGVGDLIEQRIENKKVSKKVTVNWNRTLHMSTAFGLTSGCLCHFWYNYLDKKLPGRGIRVIVQKIAWDQVTISNLNITINGYQRNMGKGVWVALVGFFDCLLHFIKKMLFVCQLYNYIIFWFVHERCCR